MVEVVKDDRVHPTVNVGSGGNVAFADVKDIEPESATISLAKGAVAGAALGALPASALYSRKNSEAILNAGEAVIKNTQNGKALGTAITDALAGVKIDKKEALIVLAGAAALGAVIHYLPTRVHNKWSERVAAATLDKQQSQPQVG